MISLKKFKNYKDILEKELTNKAFRSRMFFEGIQDEDFSNEIINYLEKLTINISSFELNKILEEIRQKTIYNYNLSIKIEELNQKINYALKSLAYFYFLESIDEHSKISEDIIEQIKEKYPSNYLELISKIDKIYLSVDTQKAIENSKEKITIDDDLLNKYIILKQWQDKQHQFYEDGYGKYLEDLQSNYCEDNSLDPFTLEQVTLRKRLFDSLSEKKILDLDTCSILSELYIKKYVVKYIGGKMYGLSVLNSKGIKVPYSVVIPTNIEVSEKDLSILKGKYGFYSVRSSADIEDGEKNSFAGMFDSYLNVSTTNLLNKIERVKESINNERLKEYILVNELEHPNMAVVIQDFREPEYAGVWVGNSNNSGVLEWVKGNGEKLVSGSSTPHSEIWIDGNCNNSLKVNDKSVGEIMLEYQQMIGSNADFEWMILDGQLIMLQFRPVTREIVVNEDYNNKQSDGFYGIPASSGIIEGQACYLDSPNEELEKNRILLAMLTDPNWLPQLMNSKGAITAYGGFLCHTAIVCRELGIPCVTGIGEEALKELSDNSNNIYLNGNNGNVKVLSKKNK